jgi:hypothetical protein
MMSVMGEEYQEVRWHAKVPCDSSDCWRYRRRDNRQRNRQRDTYCEEEECDCKCHALVRMDTMIQDILKMPRR